MIELKDKKTTYHFLKYETCFVSHKLTENASCKHEAQSIPSPVPLCYFVSHVFVQNILIERELVHAKGIWELDASNIFMTMLFLCLEVIT